MPLRQISWAARRLMSWFLKTMRPRSGLRWPVIRLKSVVLPAPFGPMTATRSPWRTVSSAPLTALKSSKDL